MGRQVTKDFRRLRQIEQDKSADDRVEHLIGLESRDIGGDEGYVSDPQTLRPTACSFEGFFSSVESNHRTGGTDQPSGEQRHIANTAANIEDIHPLANPGVTQNVLCQTFEHPRL